MSTISRRTFTKNHLPPLGMPANISSHIFMRMLGKQHVGSSLHPSASRVRSQVVAWMLLVVLLQFFVPATSLSQEPNSNAREVEQVKTIQQLLQQLGYNPGPIDGMLGQHTRTAIRTFQQNHRLPVDGEASLELLEFLKDVQVEQEVALSQMSPNQIYIRAVELETQGKTENASVYYLYLMKHYPDNDVTVQAVDRFSELAPPTPPPVPKAPSPQLSRSTKMLLGAGAAAVVGVGIIALTSNNDDGIKLGTWRCTIDYGCNGREVSRLWHLRSDHTFICLDCDDYGTWTVHGNQITMVSLIGDQIRYTGTLVSSDDSMAGTFVDIGGENGCWNAAYIY